MKPWMVLTAGLFLGAVACDGPPMKKPAKPRLQPAAGAAAAAVADDAARTQKKKKAAAAVDAPKGTSRRDQPMPAGARGENKPAAPDDDRKGAEIVGGSERSSADKERVR